MPLKHYKWVYDLRGLDTKEAVEAATGLTLPVRILTDEVRRCAAWRMHAAMAELLMCRVLPSLYHGSVRSMAWKKGRMECAAEMHA